MAEQRSLGGVGVGGVCVVRRATSAGRRSVKHNGKVRLELAPCSMFVVRSVPGGRVPC